MRHPSVQLTLSFLLSTVAQVWLKLGAGADGHASVFASLQSPWVWLGILATIGSLVTWLNALRSVPLSLAFALAGVIHALVPLASWLWLGETVSGKRWLGISLVIVGVVVSAKPATVVEEKL
jgi:multidrug transporter EmrE-like cation transporter